MNDYSVRNDKRRHYVDDERWLCEEIGLQVSVENRKWIGRSDAQPSGAR